MMTFEEKLGEIFAQLPSLTDAKSNVFPIRYNWGTIDVLNKFLLLPENQSKYPLVWLTVNEEDEDLVTGTLKRNAKILIATRSDKTDEFNEFIFQTDYKLVLMPVYKNVITALLKSGITRILDVKVKRELIPNYSIRSNEKGVIDVWNVLAFTANIEMDDNKCIKTIRF